ncbi:MAG: hypothetical protein ABI702_00565 [Burkholderiales bacterium]
MKNNARRFEFLSMVMMMLGIVALCQPWSLILHQYSVLMIIVGLIAFNVFSRVKSPAARPTETD